MDRHVWDQLDWAWHLVFGVLAAITAALLAGGDGPGAVPLLLLGAVVLAYAALGAHALRRPDVSRRGAAYLAIAAPTLATLFVITPVAAVMLFTLFPHFWRLLPTRRAVVATALMIIAIAVAGVLRVPPEQAPALIAWMAAVLGVAVLLGLWITRITDQSTKRAAVVAELDQTRAALAAASRNLGALTERERMAREIHDTLAQGFTSILLLAQGRDADPDRRLGLIEQTARENLTESRALVASMRPAGLDASGLSTALRALVERVGRELGIEVEMRIEGLERALPPGQDVVLLRVSQEALANVRKHAGAARLELVLFFDEGGARVRISDDGRGFDPAAAPSGFGLHGMRERVREVGGALDLRTAPGGGTCVEVSLA